MGCYIISNSVYFITDRAAAFRRVPGAFYMKAEERRNKIQELLTTSSKPLSASAMAERFSVSRQIIVGDIALLRAAGLAVYATPRGYMLEDEKPAGLTKRVACRHTVAETETELNIFVDNGCSVLDVIVEHPLYGQLTGELSLSSRYDVKQFIKRSQELGAKSLCMLTDDIHLHTVLFPDESAEQRVYAALREAGLLYEL